VQVHVQSTRCIMEVLRCRSAEVVGRFRCASVQMSRYDGGAEELVLSWC
jgi:hypothetical protein